MKFEKITDEKIKIIFNIEDMKSHNISSQTILDSSTFSQELLQTMLTKAEEEVGFFPNDSKLLVEATIAPNQECIFTITKLSTPDLQVENDIDSFIYKFENFDNFISLCTFLNNLYDLNLRKFSEYFSLILYNNTYYLYNTITENYSTLLDYMQEIFSEFGTKVSNSPYVDGILNEYGKKIFSKNAIVNCILHFI